MKEPWGFIIIFCLMMGTVLYLSGCTRLGLEDRAVDDWRITMKSDADECFMQIEQQREASSADDSISMDKSVIQ